MVVVVVVEVVVVVAAVGLGSVRIIILKKTADERVDIINEMLPLCVFDRSDDFSILTLH